MAVNSDTLIGTLFDGRYQVVRKLGAGGMANVYLAEDQELGRRVAIKILNDRHANDDQFVERFRLEAKNAAALGHPNIVPIYDRGEAEGTYYIAMEYLDGRSLKELIVSRGPAPVDVAVDYARQIVAALRFAHRHGIVHRDIKPHNALVDGDGRVKVTDFGIARAGASQMTEAGSIVGTAQYLSPEQARGTGVDPRSDLYSLGVVLYELLTGTLPFDGDTPVEIAMKHLSQVPEPPSVRRPDIPPALDMAVMRALAKDPEERYQSADELDADLERVARGAAVSARTEESATQIMAGPLLPTSTAATAATMISPPGARPAAGRQFGPPPPPYYDFDEPIHRRPIWPWVAAALFLLAAAIGGWFVYKQISDKLASNAPAAVNYYVNLTEQAARVKIARDGFRPIVNHHTSQTTHFGLVYRQFPQQGTRQPKGNGVTIWVSGGKPKVVVLPYKGQQVADVVKSLNTLHLKPDIHEVASSDKAGTVQGQDPKAGTTVAQGTKVRINVSQGPAPVVVPKVTGQLIDAAVSQLTKLGFRAVPRYVDSSQPVNTVTEQTPPAGKSAGKGSAISLTVSNGPKTVTLPDVQGQDVASAVQTLQGANFRTKIVYQNVADPNQDGLVLSETPAGGTQQPPGSAITLAVGRNPSGQTTTATTTTTTTATTTSFP
ncbi:MAG: Stk1 family PASTA domain-containing Ser/Thr kinase [Gaiellaceae bacterium]